MPKQIRLNAFDMNCVGHQSPGLWSHPRDQADRYNTLDYWVQLARLLERGKFDALFLADVLGIYDVYKGSPRTALENAVQVPVSDPLMVIPAMAYVTRHLGFGVTCALTYEHPYPFARRMSTLDHLTNGRVGWNIVTGYLESAARGSAPPIPYAARHGKEVARSGRESRLTDQTGKLSLAWPLNACARDAFLLRPADAFSLRR